MREREGRRKGGWLDERVRSRRRRERKMKEEGRKERRERKKGKWGEGVH